MQQFKAEVSILIGNIRAAENIDSACKLLEDFFKKFGAKLLSVKFTDVAGEYATIRPFSSYPAGLSKVSREIQKSGSYCPFSKEASIRMAPFVSMSIDVSKYPSPLDKRFFEELNVAGLSNIAIVPVMIRRAVAMFTIGLNDILFNEEIKLFLSDVMEQVTSAFIDLYPGINTMFEQSHLTAIERQILGMHCLGFASTRIQHETDLSELTVSYLMKNAARKIGADSIGQLIYKALKFNELSHDMVDQVEIKRASVLH